MLDCFFPYLFQVFWSELKKSIKCEKYIFLFNGFTLFLSSYMFYRTLEWILAGCYSLENAIAALVKLQNANIVTWRTFGDVVNFQWRQYFFIFHTFLEIDHEIISKVILCPSAESFKKDGWQIKAKVCARSTG